MKRVDAEVDRRVTDRYRLLDRAEAAELGATDRMIASRVASGRWARLHPGVYQVGPLSDHWLPRLRAAVLAAGPAASASHRAAFVLWGLDGLTTRLIEVTVPYTHGPLPQGTIVHRTRRELPRTEVEGITVTTVERTLLDTAGMLPRLVVAKGLDSAVRQGLTTPSALWEAVRHQGGRGVRGTRPLSTLIAALEESGATGSPAETELLDAMRRAGIPEPVIQYEVVLADGQRFVVDFGWPRLLKGVEVDGLDAHSGPGELENDLRRQNALLDAGIQLRRFSAREVRRDPEGVAAAIAEFLL